jgi:hypothetical protein
MNTNPDAVIDQNYEPAAGSRPQDATVRTSGGAVRRDFYDDPRRKSPVLALVLSAMPGVGQIYVGYYHQGFTNALVVASIIALLSSNLVRGAEPMFGIFLAFFWLFNVIDAWRRATFYNNALAGIGPATLPEEFAVTSGRGTLAGGVALVVVGVIALLHTLFGMPLDWIEKWWPVALIGVGVWLMYPVIAGRQGKTDASA